MQQRASETINSDLLTPSRAAEILGVVPATVIYHARTGRLPAIRTSSGLRLFLRENVEAFAAERIQRRENNK